MKNLILIPLLIAAIGVKAQTKTKSQFGADSITLCPNCIEIEPIVVTARGDTARSIYWVTGGVDRSLSGFSLTTNFYDKKGVFLTYTNDILSGAQLPLIILLKPKIDSLVHVAQPRIITQ